MDLLGIAIVAAAFVVFGLVYRHRRASCAAGDHCADPCAACPEHRRPSNVSESNHAHS